MGALMLALRDRATRLKLARWLAVAALLAAGLLVQLHFFAAYPQPIVFGDPRGYYETGQRLLEAAERWRAGESLGQVFDSARGLAFLAGVGSLFALLESQRPGDFAFFRIVLAGFNTLAMLGIFLLARRLARSELGGFFALAVAVVYPAFSVQTGRLYPDPVTGCLFVWAAWLYLRGVQTGRARWLVAGGLLLGVALLVRTQLAAYMLLVLPAALVLSCPLWLRRRETRRLALAFTLSLVPLVLAWTGIARAVSGRDDVIRYGNLTFRPSYPLGFWQFLDTDGWGGPYRIKTEPFYWEMVEENRLHPGLMSSRQRQVGFILRYVTRRPWHSLRVVLTNAYRLFDRPANDYKWDYPLPYSAQVWLQRGIVVLALAGLALFAAESGAALGVFLLPLSLLVLHGLTFTWPRYNVPVMPILIAAAGAFLARLVSTRVTLHALRSRPAGAAAALGALGLAGGAALFFAAPAPARALRLLGTLAVLALPFLVAWRLTATRRAGRVALAAYGGLGLLVLANAVGDREWHGTEIALGRQAAAVEQEIRLSGEAIASLRAAREAFVVFDMIVPAGDPRALAVQIGGRSFAGTDLVPTMPRLPESTSTGGRDWRWYPQWWALPLDTSLLPGDPARPLNVRLSAAPGATARLGADRHSAQQRIYEGPSFGEWPHLVPLKLEYDGDYRRAVSYTLASEGTMTTLVGRDGRRRSYAGVARIRVVALTNDEGSTAWLSAAPPATRAAFGFFAYSGVRGAAEMTIDGRGALTFPLGGSGDFDLRAEDVSLCRRSLGERGDRPYGAFVLVAPARRARPLELGVRFRTGMSDRAMYFIVDARRPFADLAPFFERCGVDVRLPRVAGVASVIDATRNQYPEDTGRWALAAVY